MEVKKHGITGSTPMDAAKRIKEHTDAKQKALGKKMIISGPTSFNMYRKHVKNRQGGFEDEHGIK